MTYNESPCIPWPLPYQKDFFKAKYIRIIGHLQHCIPVCTSTWNLAQKICAQCFLEEKTICFGGDEYGLHDMDYCNKKDCCLLFQVKFYVQWLIQCIGALHIPQYHPTSRGVTLADQFVLNSTNICTVLLSYFFAFFALGSGGQEATLEYLWSNKFTRWVSYTCITCSMHTTLQCKIKIHHIL